MLVQVRKSLPEQRPPNRHVHSHSTTRTSSSVRTPIPHPDSRLSSGAAPDGRPAHRYLSETERRRSTTLDAGVGLGLDPEESGMTVAPAEGSKGCRVSVESMSDMPSEHVRPTAQAVRREQVWAALVRAV